MSLVRFAEAVGRYWRDLVRCPTCHGGGRINVGMPGWPPEFTDCYECRGAREVSYERAVSSKRPGKIERNMSTPEARAFWGEVKRSARGAKRR